MPRHQEKAPDAFRTIGEAAAELDVPQHVLRFWETKFGALRPLKRGGKRRYYRPDDIELLRGIRALLYRDGLTIRCAQDVFKEKGARFVADLGRGALRLVSPPEAGMEAGIGKLSGAARARAEELLAELLSLKTRLGEARARLARAAGNS